VTSGRSRREERALRIDPLIRAAATRTPAEIESWIDANVTDLASAKQVLKALVKAMVFTLRRVHERALEDE
jgi:hypothetical protein